MNIVRTVKSKDFTVLSNKIFRNKGLSLRARGLLCTVLSLSAEWDLNISGLAKFIGCGKTQIKTALDEIIEAGYLIKVGQIRKAGKFDGYEWILVDDPDMFNGSKSNENGQKIDDLPLRKIGYGESGSKSNENGQKTDDLPLRKNRCGKTAAENRTQININHQVSSNKYQSFINQNDIDDFIQKSNERFKIQLNRTLVTEFLKKANNDFCIIEEAIKRTVAAARSQCTPIRSVRAYVTKTIERIASENNDIQYNADQAAESRRAAIKEKTDKQLEQVRAINYANLEAADDSEFRRYKPDFTQNEAI